MQILCVRKANVNELHLFAGVGGGILGGMLLGHTCVCAVEIEPYCQKVLLQRQRDGMLPHFPIWDDVRTFDGRPWRGLVDIVCGGFPCQDISCAGKGAGLAGARSGLWSEFARIIGEVRPQYAFVENSPVLTVRGLGRVLGDLSALGYDAKWLVMGADDVGAPHRRKRIWILAHARHGSGRRNLFGKSGGLCSGRSPKEWRKDSDTSVRPSVPPNSVPDADSLRSEQPQGCVEDVGRRTGNRSSADISNAEVPRQPSGIDGQGQVQFGRGCSWWRTDPADAEGAFESQLGRVAYGVANRVDRLKAIGNGQVPLVAASAFEHLQERLKK